MLENLRTFCGVDEPEELLSLTAGDVRAMADAYARFGLGVVPAEVVELAVVELAAFQGSGGRCCGRN